VLEALAEPMARHGTAFGHLLGCASNAVRGFVEVALIAGESRGEMQPLADVVSSLYTPGLLIAGAEPREDVALLAQRESIGGRATAYVCRHRTCDLPTTDPATLHQQLERALSA
jgi:uncharacterized protein YyaL (SSP411 family)